MSSLSMYEIIDKKKNGGLLSKEELSWVITGLLSGEVKEYQMSALLMAIYFKGMSSEETAYLTDAMLYSGKTLNFDGVDVVDKHSTGGIGDKASFILAPIAAACGVKVPMIAGRGLGFTGGTIDKIESITGFKTDIALSEFKELVMKNKISLMGQTKEIAPADRIIYGLRDVTATIDSIPLITASIMSKKLAEGANGIVMDIKVGSGAFMKNKTIAKQLARSINNTAKRFNKKSVCLLTNMNQPLGNMVGNALEIIESINVLKGGGAKDITDLSIELAAWMVYMAEKESTITKARKACKESIKNGSAMDMFEHLITSQGGNLEQIKNTSLLPKTSEQTIVHADKGGYLKSFENQQIGLLAVDLGAGRKRASDSIDPAVGFEFHKKIGDKVKEGDPLATIFHHKGQKEMAAQMRQKLQSNIIKTSKSKVSKPDTVYEIIGKF